jgi:ubiquinone/menaquinone biosynthesis C-methylase UbiE
LIKALLRRFFPQLMSFISYYRRYQNAKKLMPIANPKADFEKLAAAATPDKACLQIGVRESKLAPHWKVVDLYDPSPLVDFHYDVQDMAFEDERFDFVVCPAILEHVPYPQKAIAEMRRILKTGGEIWVEIPMNQPYHPSPQDYWRVTPEGLRIWLADFEEIKLGVHLIEGSPFYNAVYFHGRKIHHEGTKNTKK